MTSKKPATPVGAMVTDPASTIMCVLVPTEMMLSGGMLADVPGGMDGSSSAGGVKSMPPGPVVLVDTCCTRDWVRAPVRLPAL
ncbi:hypothetical protein [Mycobacterium genavense]|uniref:hypothetical protein n=1 Tax=Mycobacterium genavense TaxID=36812 RepID=UPI0012EB4EA0|nr:hypothetical protein [Mycobacterium genavense]